MKKAFVTLLVALLLLSCLPLGAGAAMEKITDSKLVAGSDYTDIPYIAETLDDIFAGNVGLCSDYACKKTVSTPLGCSKVAPGVLYLLPDQPAKPFGGYSCYIYANAVYLKLFGDLPGNGSGLGWQHSEAVLRNKASVSYEMFTEAGIKTGALLRTTGSRKGNYDPNKGHSIIILNYDENSIRFLDGNGDGKGLIRVNHFSWAEFNWDLFTRRTYRLSFIVQPTDAYYATLLPFDHDYAGYFAPERSYEGAFTDVAPTSWSYRGIVTAYELGLMNGRGADLFAPDENVTVVEAITMTARLLSQYWDDEFDFTPGEGQPWYDRYVYYCGLWGVNAASLGELTAPITRGDFARLCAKVLPEEELIVLHKLEEGAFLDVSADDACHDAVYSLCSVGVLTGNEGLFSPEGTLTRGQAATIAARLADRAQRG